MASVPVTIIGVMTYTDIGVGGGPMPGGPEVSHPIAPGGQPPSIWPSPGYPAHPIAPGGPPPGIWPSPGHPSHPIAPGGQPPGIWGGGNVPMPNPPIYFPPPIPPEPPPAEGWDWVWSPIYGWVAQPGGDGGKPQPPHPPGSGSPPAPDNTLPTPPTDPVVNPQSKK